MKGQHNIAKILFIPLFLMVFSINAMSFTNTETEKKNNKSTEKKTTETKDPGKEKPDSLKVVVDENQFPVANKLKGVVYKPERYLEQDTLDESGSVVSFNFIQYIIQNFKFSEEVY